MRKSIMKLVLATLSMLLLIFTFTVTTYAWVTINNTPEIGEIQFSTVDEANYYISVDGMNFGKTIRIQDIYEALSVDYPNAFRKDDAYIRSYGRYKRVETYQYQYKYGLMTPLATETGFVNSFYKMNHSVVDDHTEFIFENLTALMNEQGAVEEVYNPEDGYLKFTLYVKSDINSHLYLFSSDVSYSDNAMANDITSSSMVRVGFETSLYDNLSQTVTVDDSDYVMKHLKIYEPVTTLPSNVSEYVGGYLDNSTGSGKYFSQSYIDAYVGDMRDKILSLDVASSRAVFSNTFSNVYGITSLDKLYNVASMNNVIDNKLSNVTRIIVEQDGDDYTYPNLEEATPLMELVAGESQAMTVYIWLEGWDGAAGDFSQQGKFNLSFNFIEVKISKKGIYIKMKSMKKLLTASIMLVVALMAVVSSTYAWFTTSNPLTVSDLDVNVAASTGVYMSLNYEQATPESAVWTTGLTADQIVAATQSKVVNGTGAAYSPVCVPILTTGEGEVATQSLDFTNSFKKIVMNGTSHTLENAAEGTDYSRIRIWFRADSATTLNVNSLAVTAEGNSNIAATSMLRIAFVSGTSAKIYKAFEDSISGIGVTENYTDNEGNEYPSFYSSNHNGFPAFVISQVLTAGETTDGRTVATIGNATYANYASLFTDLNTSYGNTNNLTDIVTIAANEVVALDIYIWLEGWDSLCITDLDQTSFRFNFILTPNGVSA